MTAIRIRFTFDYVDPGSYLVHELLARWVEARGGSHAPSLHPLELRTPSSAPLDPDDPEWRALMEAMATFADQESVPFRAPALVPWTRKAHELAFHAHEKGCFREMHHTLFRAHFEEGRDIGRVDVLVELGQSVGLDASETRTVLGVDRFLHRVEEARREARLRGIRGVPTLEADGQRLEGLRSPDELRAFMGGGNPCAPGQT